MSPRSFCGRGVFAGLLALGVVFPGAAAAAGSEPATVEAIARARQRFALGVAGGRAFEYFARGSQEAWDAYLKRLRPPPLSADRRARALALVRKQDLVEPAVEQQAKLGALHPVLAYLERDTATEVKVLRLDLAWAGLLEGAAILISPDALDLLTPAELQAVIAHELAHEYFAGEYDQARAKKQYDTVKEIELRCDAVSIVTMSRLGLDRSALLSGVAKLTAFNERRGFPNSRDLSPSWDERRNFGRAMAELTK
jgi:Peptidase family M48